MKRLGLLLCLLLCMAAPAAASEVEDLGGLLESRGFSREHIERITEQVRLAQKNGLPLAPMIDKVHEGLAKQVDAPRIARAVEQVADRYAFAWDRAGDLAAEPQEVARAATLLAEAMAAGLSREDAEGITVKLRQRRHSPTAEPDDRLVPETMETARDMARYGVTSETVGRVITDALDHAYTGEDMAAMRQSFAERTRYGIPESTARGFARDIGAGKGVSSLGASGRGRGGQAGSGGGDVGAGGGSAGSSGSGGGSGGGGGGSSAGGGGAGGGAGGVGGGSGSGGTGGGGTGGGGTGGGARR